MNINTAIASIFEKVAIEVSKDQLCHVSWMLGDHDERAAKSKKFNKADCQKNWQIKQVISKFEMLSISYLFGRPMHFLIEYWNMWPTYSDNSTAWQSPANLLVAKYKHNLHDGNGNE